MRILIALPLLLVAACNVDKDERNGTTTVEFNHDAAENLAKDAANTAENVGGAIANDVERTADKVQNKVGDVDVDVDVNREPTANRN